MSLTSIFGGLFHRKAEPTVKPITEPVIKPEEVKANLEVEAQEIKTPPIEPVNLGNHPKLFWLLRRAINAHEAELDNARTQDLKSDVSRNLNSILQKIVENLFSGNLTEENAINQINGLNEWGIEKYSITHFLNVLLEQETDRKKQETLINLLYKTGDEWKILCFPLRSKNHKHKDLWINYLKALSDNELKDLISKFDYYGFEDSERKTFLESLLEIRDESFIFNAFLQALLKERKYDKDTNNIKIEINKIISVILEKRPELESYDLLETLYRNSPITTRKDLATELIKKFPDKAPELFLTISREEIFLDFMSYHSIAHYRWAIQAGLVEKKEGIKNIVEIMNNAKDNSVLVSSVGALLYQFGNEGMTALVDEVEKEIREVSIYTPEFVESDFGKGSVIIDTNGAILRESTGESWKGDKLKPKKLALLSILSRHSSSAFNALKEIYSKKYEDNELVKAYMMSDKTNLLYIYRTTNGTISYQFNERTMSVFSIIDEITLEMFLEMIESENTNLRENSRNVLEFLINISTKNQVEGIKSGLHYKVSSGNHPDIYALADRPLPD